MKKLGKIVLVLAIVFAFYGDIKSGCKSFCGDVKSTTSKIVNVFQSDEVPLVE